MFLCAYVVTFFSAVPGVADPVNKTFDIEQSLFFTNEYDEMGFPPARE